MGNTLPFRVQLYDNNVLEGKGTEYDKINQLKGINKNNILTLANQKFVIKDSEQYAKIYYDDDNDNKHIVVKIFEKRDNKMFFIVQNFLLEKTVTMNKESLIEYLNTLKILFTNP